MPLARLMRNFFGNQRWYWAAGIHPRSPAIGPPGAVAVSIEIVKFKIRLRQARRAWLRRSAMAIAASDFLGTESIFIWGLCFLEISRPTHRQARLQRS